MNKTKRNQIFTTKKIDSILKKLDKLPKKEKSEFNLRETICRFKDKLNRALKHGYSYEDLSNILAEQEVFVSVNMLKQYLRDANNKTESSSAQNNCDVSISEQNEVNGEPLVANNSSSSSHLPSKKSGFRQKISNSNSSAKKQSQKDKHQKSKTQAEDTSVEKTSVLSGYSGDLSGDFNQY